jgi:glycosyltransferase involved in cell wall biosynthesis
MVDKTFDIIDEVADRYRKGAGELSLSVIVPTRNEAGNIDMLLSSIRKAVAGTAIEIIFVDDSSDDTPQVVEAARGHFPDLNVHLIHRTPEMQVGGLGGAVVAGLRAAQAEYAVVMDGDLQHPPEMLPVLLQTAYNKKADLVVATRRDKDSQVTGLNQARNLISRALDMVARVMFPRSLKGVSDPLTGFFLVRVKALCLEDLHPKGFKILMEILVRNPTLVKAEVPFHFGERFAGQSKASAKEVFRYLNLLWTLRFGEGSLRFIAFALVGLSGILVNSLALYLATDKLKIYYLISAAIATVVSTLWNFSLTEWLVYRSATQANGLMRRLGLFFVMNVIALALRSPVIFALTSLLGLNYVISNLISLGILTVLRFVLADNMIWGQSVAAKKIFSYDIHGLVTVVSEGLLPELEPFRVDRIIEQPTIRVRIGMPAKKNPSMDQNIPYLHYQDVIGHVGFEVGIQFGDQVDVVATPLLRLSPHVLYTNVVEPILRWTFVKKGYALVHGATIAFGGDAYMITALTDTGKTTTLLKILSHQRRDGDSASFISDDMTVVSPDGTAMTYPKPMTISHHTLRAVNSETLSFSQRLILPFQSRIHSRSGRQIAGFISKTKLPAATINMYVQMVVPPPKYYVQKLVPNVKRTAKAKYVGMFIIERGGEGTVPVESSEALEVLFKNCEDAYGFPPYENLKEFLYCGPDGVDLREKEHAIIRQAMGNLPAVKINSKNLEWWCRIPTYVDPRVAKDCACDSNKSAQPVQLETAGAGR